MSKPVSCALAVDAAGGTLPPRPNAFSSRQGIFLAGSVVVLAALAVYANSFSGPFIFDDIQAIPNNPSAQASWNRFVAKPG